MNGEKQKARPKGVNLMYAENEIRIAILWLDDALRAMLVWEGHVRSQGGRVGFLENTTMRHSRGGGREVTVTSRPQP